MGQTNLSVASLREDVELLSRTVGQLQLRVESLERQNDDLQQRQQRQQQTLAALSARLATFGDTLEPRLDGLPAREQSLRREITGEVARLIEQLQREIQRQLDGMTAPAAAVPETPSVVLDDNFPQNGVRYTVQRGETMSGIARDHGSRVIWIQKANRITDPRTLRAGQEIFIPQEAE